MQNKDKHLPAFPTPPKQYSEEYRQRLIESGHGDRADFGFLYPGEGISKREYAAIKAMQGLLANGECKNDFDGSITTIANKAVDAADALFKALDETMPGNFVFESNDRFQDGVNFVLETLKEFDANNLKELTEEKKLELILTKFHGHTKEQWENELVKKYPFCEIPYLVETVWKAAKQ